MLRLRSVWVLALALLLAGAAHADVMLFDRGLPTANLNNAAGSARSNVSWGDQGNQSYTGDDFLLPVAPGVSGYLIDTLRIWTADGDGPGFDFSSLYQSLTLFAQPTSGSGAGIIQQGNFTGGTGLDNPNIKITAVTYSDGSVYQGNSSTYQLWQVDFTNLNWLVDPGTVVNFGVFGETVDPNYFWVNHASNAALGGSPHDGSDNTFLDFAVGQPNALLNPTTEDSNGAPLWDKSSDINVQVFGDPVPEPSSWILLGTLTSLIGYRFRRRVF